MHTDRPMMRRLPLICLSLAIATGGTVSTALAEQSRTVLWNTAEISWHDQADSEIARDRQGAQSRLTEQLAQVADAIGDGWTAERFTVSDRKSGKVDRAELSVEQAQQALRQFVQEPRAELDGQGNREVQPRSRTVQVRENARNLWVWWAEGTNDEESEHDSFLITSDREEIARENRLLPAQFQSAGPQIIVRLRRREGGAIDERRSPIEQFDLIRLTAPSQVAQLPGREQLAPEQAQREASRAQALERVRSTRSSAPQQEDDQVITPAPSTDDHDKGSSGCAAGGSSTGGLAGLLLALGFAFIRRRR